MKFQTFNSYLFNKVDYQTTIVYLLFQTLLNQVCLLYSNVWLCPRLIATGFLSLKSPNLFVLSIEMLSPRELYEFGQDLAR